MTDLKKKTKGTPRTESKNKKSKQVYTHRKRKEDYKRRTVFKRLDRSRNMKGNPKWEIKKYRNQ